MGTKSSKSNKSASSTQSGSSTCTASESHQCTPGAHLVCISPTSSNEILDFQIANDLSALKPLNSLRHSSPVLLLKTYQNLCVSISKQKVIIWDLASGISKFAPTPTTSVTSVAFSLDKNLIALISPSFVTVITNVGTLVEKIEVPQSLQGEGWNFCSAHFCKKVLGLMLKKSSESYNAQERKLIMVELIGLRLGNRTTVNLAVTWNSGTTDFRLVRIPAFGNELAVALCSDYPELISTTTGKELSSANLVFDRMGARFAGFNEDNLEEDVFFYEMEGTYASFSHDKKFDNFRAKIYNYWFSAISKAKNLAVVWRNGEPEARIIDDNNYEKDLRTTVGNGAAVTFVEGKLVWVGQGFTLFTTAVVAGTDCLLQFQR